METYSNSLLVNWVLSFSPVTDVAQNVAANKEANHVRHSWIKNRKGGSIGNKPSPSWLHTFA